MKIPAPTKAQSVYIEAKKAGLSPTNAARKAYPDAKRPSNAAAQAERSDAVVFANAKSDISKMSMAASGQSYAFLILVLMNDVYDMVYKKGKKEKVHSPCSISERIKASVELHKSYGFGRIKCKDGEDPFEIGEMSEAQLQEFVNEGEAQMSGDVIELVAPALATEEEIDAIFLEKTP